MKPIITILITLALIFSLSCNGKEVSENTEIETTEEKSTVEISTETAETEPAEAETEIFTENATFYTTTANASEIGSKIAFYYDDGEEVYITAAEYEEICGVVMNETGYGSYEGCVAVAQSIRNQIIRERELGHAYDIASVRKTYQEHYTKTPNERVRRAVTDVFYNHTVVTTEPIIAWCAGYSEWHASQVQVCSFDGNDFYKLSVKDW